MSEIVFFEKNINKLDGLTFVVAVNDHKVLEQNLFLSPIFKSTCGLQVIEKSGYHSASIAYNEAIEDAINDIIVFVHQDVYLPDNWLDELTTSIYYLENICPSWGVLGCFGSAKGKYGGIGRVYTNGLGLHGNVINNPEKIETLDEILLVFRKSSGLRFDPFFPHFHLYGTDICMRAREKGLTNFAIPAFCIHNTNLNPILPKEFFDCYYIIKKKWSKYLPIWASCITITRFNYHIYMRNIRFIYNKLFHKVVKVVYRLDDPRVIIESIANPYV